MSATPNSMQPIPAERAILPSSTDVPVQTGGAAAHKSALSLAREAITRWRGAPPPAWRLAPDTARISPQARWLAATQASLDLWIESGGFDQSPSVPSPLPEPAKPGMYSPTSPVPACEPAARLLAYRLS